MRTNSVKNGTLTLMQAFQNGCITYLLSGLVSIALYCKEKNTKLKRSIDCEAFTGYFVLIESVQMLLRQILLVEGAHFFAQGLDRWIAASAWKSPTTCADVLITIHCSIKHQLIGLDIDSYPGTRAIAADCKVAPLVRTSSDGFDKKSS